MLTVSDAWKATYAEAAQGLLVMRGVTNPEHHVDLETRKAELEGQLRARFSGYDRSALSALPCVQLYVAYYGKFKKTYHVQLQLESVALKGKSLPRVAALVEAMFMNVLFTVYAPPGIEPMAVQRHLEDLQANVLIVAPQAAVELLNVYRAE